MTSQPQKSDRKTCDCGTLPTSENARKVVKYSTWGMIAMGLVGISASPIDIYYVCKICKQPFGRLSKEERKSLR
ncbi:hypothetical protein EHQ58_03025 [Leptospira ognonensis]|uniref:LITAF domain-containing protein n=1 Tax=Leptospira ognonensis TaxID=2484945 RepID=A0A4V3JRY3_9LEPT|nr:hypothetical protein [Leptospira ognonensis]TGL62191.1 hypothetical protein EHQ58_03025 [Leptospira ognonensis]